jgi:uncharacterized RDD family membrane protein YckC
MDCIPGGDPAVSALPPDDTPATELPVCIAADAPEAEPDVDYWRHEVAARLQRYRARRKPREPRYPSLRLPFDAAENALRSSTAERPSYQSPVQTTPIPAVHVLPGQNVALQFDAAPIEDTAHALEPQAFVREQYEQASNVIEFPRSAAIPVFQKEELAEPIWDRPRIVEAPEVVPLPPAMGGILIEAVAEKEAPRRKPEDVPLDTASLGRRILAGVVDFLILGTAVAAFGAIFWRVNPERPPILLLAAGLAIVITLLWAAYQFLFVVYTGSTPGLRVARLCLARFDGSPLTKRTRRWRILASYLSALSLGFGYLWSFLDEDGLCWHDRITRTQIQRKPSKPKAILPES